MGLLTRLIMKHPELKDAKVWFTSDEHYSSKRHIELSRRDEFMEVSPNGEKIYHIDRMDSRFITCHNSVVGEHDLVIHLGDFGNRKMVKYLNGYHVLIFGNYEEDEMKEYAEKYGVNKLKAYQEIFYKEIGNKPGSFIEFSRSDYFNKADIEMLFSNEEFKKELYHIGLTHKPSRCVQSEDHGVKKFTVEGETKYFMNIFGHIHEKAKCKRFGVNVGVDCCHYTPVSSEYVEFYLNAILHHYDEEVFM